MSKPEVMTQFGSPGIASAIGRCVLSSHWYDTACGWYQWYRFDGQWRSLEVVRGNRPEVKKVLATRTNTGYYRYV